MPSTAGKDVTLALGIASATGKLLTTRQSANDKPDGFHFVCPDEAHDPAGPPAQARQVWSCEDQHGPFDRSVIEAEGRCLDVDGALVRFTTEEVAAIRDPGTAGKHIDFVPHPIDQVAGQRLTGTVYAFDHSTAGAGFIAMLCEILNDGKVALLGTVTLRKNGNPKIVRAVATAHGVELAEIVPPEEVYEFAPVELVAKPGDVKVGRMLVKALTVDFDPAAYRGMRGDRVAAVLEAKADGGTVSPLTAPAKPTVDLEAALLASLAAVESTTPADVQEAAA